MITAAKHTGSQEDVDHYLDANGGTAYKDFCWFYFLPRIRNKSDAIEINWLCYSWTIWNKL